MPIVNDASLIEALRVPTALCSMRDSAETSVIWRIVASPRRWLNVWRLTPAIRAGVVEFCARQAQQLNHPAVPPRDGSATDARSSFEVEPECFTHHPGLV